MSKFVVNVALNPTGFDIVTAEHGYISVRLVSQTLMPVKRRIIRTFYQTLNRTHSLTGADHLRALPAVAHIDYDRI